MVDLVSIVMPAFNVAPYVEEAVATLHAQTHPAIELVAIDDGSGDGTGELLRILSERWRGEGRRMIVVSQENEGAAAARNAGLARAKGAFICFLDADDRIAPDLVTRLVDLLQTDVDLVLAAPLWRYIDTDGRPTGVISDPRGLRHDAASLAVKGPLHSATGVMVRAEAARATAPFDTTLKGCIDLDWFVRILAGRGAAAGIVPEPLADYRKRAGQITADWRRMEDNWRRVLNKMAAAGYGLGSDEARRARACKLIYWATLAYQGGDYPAARRLIAESWRLAPGAALGDPLARIRTLAAMASLLPKPIHEALRRRVGSAA